MVAFLFVGLLLLMPGATRAASASPLLDLDYVPASALATTVVCQAQGGGCDYDGARLTYDAPAHVALEHDAELAATEAALVGLKGAGAEAAASVSHVYDASASFVAPQSAIGFTAAAVASPSPGIRTRGGQARPHRIDPGLPPTLSTRAHRESPL